MNRTRMTMSKGVLLSGALALGVFATPAQAQIEITLFPPVAFRATSRPVYYDGHAAYWYGNRWYYQERGEWQYYREEPIHLRAYRSNRAPQRQHYERRHHRGHR